MADLNLYTAEPRKTFWMLVYDDNSDHGESTEFFATEGEARNRWNDVLREQTEGNQQHPAPENPASRLFTVTMIESRRTNTDAY